MNTHKTIAVVVAIIVIIGAVYFMSSKSPGTTFVTTPAPITEGNGTPGTAALLNVTQSDNGKTITLAKEDRFVLALGEMNWTVSISDPNVISRVKNLAMIRGAQGVYTADNVGTTKLSAEGRPVCNPGEMCAQYIISWNVNIIVK